MTRNPFIIANMNNCGLADFLKNGVENYFKELEKYINDNEDEDILAYANEATMASLFMCGNLRVNPQMTGVQEYGTICTKYGKEVRGRPDIFIKDQKRAIWIECKYQKSTHHLGDEHWDIPAWLAWDKVNVFNQVETYYNSESEKLNSSYEERFIVTLCFKRIHVNAEKHNKEVKQKLERHQSSTYDRTWYYQVGFLPGKESMSYGLEVYGTCSGDLTRKK
ncbi:MAG: hypothetical protein JWQ27_765 [Ferruginibacter sp.]|nr:hypothetical protein [Ferruginibacter sp.]